MCCSSTDPARFSECGRQVLAALKSRPALANVSTDLQEDGPALIINVDRVAAGRLGVSMQDVNNALYNAFGQRQISTIFGQANQYRVVLEADPALPDRPGDRWKGCSCPGVGHSRRCRPSIAAGPRQPDSALLLRHASNARRRRSPSSACSNSRRRPSASIWRRASARSGRGRHRRRRSAKSACLPRSSAVSRARREEFNASLANQPWLILAAIIVIYIVLGVLYESFIHPFTILTTLPSAGIGALMALQLFGPGVHLRRADRRHPLMGIVKKNAIIMIDFALEAQRERGMAPFDAIREAVPAALPADHDDHLRRAARRDAAGARTTGPARSCACRSASPSSAACCSASSHALHHAGHLSRHGRLEGPARRRGGRHHRLRGVAARDRGGGSQPCRPSAHRSSGAAMNISGPFIRRPVAHGAALRRRCSSPASSPISPCPSPACPMSTCRRISVTPAQPGAVPETMAATVAAPLERRIGEISGVTELTSSSRLGFTSVTVQFDLAPQCRGRRARRPGRHQRRASGFAGQSQPPSADAQSQPRRRRRSCILAITSPEPASARTLRHRRPRRRRRGSRRSTASPKCRSAARSSPPSASPSIPPR